MPGIDGIRGAAELMQKGFGGKIIMLTVQEDSDFVRAAFESGAMGYVIKSRIGTDLAIAIREVLAGRTFISSSLDYNSNIGH
jgi:DNA-binding NarL/FixJ family response regulator